MCVRACVRVWINYYVYACTLMNARVEDKHAIA